MPTVSRQQQNLLQQNIKELSTAQIACVAGLPKAPSIQSCWQQNVRLSGETGFLGGYLPLGLYQSGPVPESCG